mgnify:CR=1 FL=1
MQYTPKTQDFFQNVFDVVRLIPKGRVTSYGAIAKYLGTGGSSRMVGWAMNASHTLADISYTTTCFAEVQKRLQAGYYRDLNK